MTTSIRVCALFTLALLVPGFWAAGWVYPQYNTGGGLGRMGPGFTTLGVACLTAPLALILAGLVIVAACRSRQWGWLAASAVALIAAFAAPPTYGLVAAPSPSTPLAPTYVPFLLLFAAEALIVLIALLYSFTTRTRRP